MRVVIRAILIAASALFGACAGAVTGMVGCLVLRDGLQWDMPLSRTLLIAGVFAAAGAAVSLLIDRRSVRAAPASPARDRTSESSTERARRDDASSSDSPVADSSSKAT